MDHIIPIEDIEIKKAASIHFSRIFDTFLVINRETLAPHFLVAETIKDGKTKYVHFIVDFHPHTLKNVGQTIRGVWS